MIIKKPSDDCINLVKSFEGLKLTAYLDIVKKITIGYGHTGPDVYEGMIITPELANEYLTEDLGEACSQVVSCVKVDLEQYQLDALISFVFNLGIGRFKESTLLHLLNSGEYRGAADEFPRWCHAAGHIVPDLVRRRECERNLFLSIQKGE